jgi:polyisoprenoid-binding protein YceI
MATHTWNVDVTHSSINFSIRHMVVSKVRGRFTKFSGTVQLDEGGDLTRSSVEASLDASSVDTGAAQRDEHLRGADFFDVDRFPQLRFQSTSVAKLAGDRYRVIGKLTIRDITREVVLDAEYAGRGKDPWGSERVGFSAKTAIDRKDFGLVWNQALEAGGVLVGDRVEIELDVQVLKAASWRAA